MLPTPNTAGSSTVIPDLPQPPEAAAPKSWSSPMAHAEPGRLCLGCSLMALQLAVLRLPEVTAGREA